MSVIKVDEEAVKVISVGTQGPAGAGASNIFDYIDFNVSAIQGMQIARLRWNDTVKTIEIGLSNDVTLQIGQEILIRVRNNSGAPIGNGVPVYLFGATGAVPTIRLADASDYDKTTKTIAITTEAIGNNEFGFVCAFGMVSDINTSSFTDGDVLYLGTTPGTITKTKPTYPNNILRLGVCAYSNANTGKIFFSHMLENTKFGDVLAGNYTAFKDNGHLVFVGTAKTTRDELGDALSLRVQGTGLSANVTESVVEYTAASDLSDYLYKNLQLNHDRELAGVINPHIHFFQASNAVPNFLLQYRWQINGGAKVTVWTNLRCNTAVFTYTSGTLHQIARTASGITPTVGTTVSDIVQFRIIRDNANTSGVFAGADPYTGTVGVLSFDVHLSCDSVGSDTEYAK